MEGQKQFSSEKVEHQVYLDDQTRCCLCGSELIFKHKIDYLTLQVREDADCPSCKICLKSKEYGLH